MSKHERKHCPRCNGLFECKPGNITQCQCFGVQFNEEEKRYIDAKYTDCLCVDCLLALKNEYGEKAKRLPLQENEQ